VEVEIEHRQNKLECKYFFKKFINLIFFQEIIMEEKSFQCTPACTSTSYNRSTRKCEKCGGNVFIKCIECSVWISLKNKSKHKCGIKKRKIGEKEEKEEIELIQKTSNDEKVIFFCNVLNN